MQQLVLGAPSFGHIEDDHPLLCSLPPTSSRCATALSASLTFAESDQISREGEKIIFVH
jgi:hypothetical protein